MKESSAAKAEAGCGVMAFGPSASRGFGGRASGYGGGYGMGRRAQISSGGGTKQSESTVALSLAWLAKHQTADAGWRFDPPAGAEKGYANPGTWKSNSGATALATLSFLGAGQTHKNGPYHLNIAAAIRWLIRYQKPDGDLSAGGSPEMLSHGLATTALCETYGMTADRTVGNAAQQAIKFIVASQDEKTGGWAEPSGQPSMALSAWQIMALKSGKMAGLDVPASTLEKATKFLDSLQAEGGVKYGETEREGHERLGHDHGPAHPNVPRHERRIQRRNCVAEPKGTFGEGRGLQSLCNDVHA